MSAPDQQVSSPVEPPAEPVNRRAAWKVVLTVVVAVGSLSGLLWASTREGAEYYKYVDEVTQQASRYAGKRLRVHGFVVENSIESAQGSINSRFKMETRQPRSPAVIVAEFQGIPPDTFKGGAEVIAAGILSTDGHLRADRIETKCPSKYEAK
jgi:cytochrome c-type biogenesis protein CcmE